MNVDFLKYYEDELRHIRDVAADFGALHPLVAGQLRLRKDGCDDPFVERLLEGFAYLAARVNLKLDENYPVFTESLLEAIYPSLITPTPSMGIVELTPSKSLTTKSLVKKGTELTGLLGDTSSTRCLFKVAHELEMQPFCLSKIEKRRVKYFDRDISSLYLPKESVSKAGVRLAIDLIDTDSSFDSIECPDEITLFVSGDFSKAGKIIEEIITQQIEIFVGEDVEGKKTKYQKLICNTNSCCVDIVGFDEKDSLLPIDKRVFEGYRILREFSVLPERLLFIRIKGIKKALQKVHSNKASIVLGLKRASLDMSKFISEDSFLLNVTPVVNLFERRADLINLKKGKYEFQINVNKTKPIDFEVFSVASVEGLSTSKGLSTKFSPFYKDRHSDSSGTSYYSLSRRDRALSVHEKKQGAISKYRGSEVYISIVESDEIPYSDDWDSLSIKVTCSNRHLPLSMPLRGSETDLLPEGGNGISCVRWIVPPTLPRESLVKKVNRWDLINHLSLNYLSLIEPSESGDIPLKDILRIYFDNNTEQMDEWINAIQSIDSKPVVDRFIDGGIISYVRGIEVDLVLDEYRFGGANALLFGTVIARFLSLHVAINSFINTNIISSTRGLLKTWKFKSGSQPLA